jgi:hypothetical protein
MSTGLTRISLVVIVVAVAIGGFGIQRLFTRYVRTMTDAALPGWSSARTTSMERVTVSLFDARTDTELTLSVPKAYMVRGENWSGGRQEIIRIETRLPDLLPAEATPQVVGERGSAEYGRSMTEFTNGIVMSLGNSYSDPGRGTHERLRQRFSRNTRSGSHEAFELVDEDEFLSHYREFSCQPSQTNGDAEADDANMTCREAFQDDYISRDETRPSAQVICPVWNLPSLTYRLGCTAYTSYRGFSLNYVFRYTELHRWQEFDSGVRQLLEKFAVED